LGEDPPRIDGKVLGQIPCEVAALALAATADGVWAVCHPGGVCLGQGRELLRRLPFDALTCASLDETGNWLAVGTRSGAVHALDLTTGKHHHLRLETPITGLAFGRLGGWFICTADLLHRADLDLSRHHELIESGNHASGCVASPDGSLCAFRAGRHRVIVVESTGEEIGFVYYPKRLVGEIEFGPFPWLGVGIGSGDGNRISLLEDDLIYRTDVLPGRPDNAWAVGSEFDRERVLEEREKVRSLGLLPGGDVPMDALAVEG
jgi:hypothetical protein